jgi:hypothetical protein
MGDEAATAVTEDHLGDPPDAVRPDLIYCRLPGTSYSYRCARVGSRDGLHLAAGRGARAAESDSLLMN